MRPIALLLLCLVLLAAPAAADEPSTSSSLVEVFVLDNGFVVRGRVVREFEDRLVVRLSGLLERNTITLRRSEIRERKTHADLAAAPVVRLTDTEAMSGIDYSAPVGQPRTTRYDSEGVERTVSLPEDEPELEREGFGARLVRVTRMSFPPSLEGRLLVGFLLLLALSVIVGGGARMLGMKAPTLHASTTLGFLLGVFLLADILLHADMLRADRALWILPLQAGIWCATARALLDAPLSRIVPLLAMVLFASTCFMFLTGSLLVSL